MMPKPFNPFIAKLNKACLSSFSLKTFVDFPVISKLLKVIIYNMSYRILTIGRKQFEQKMWNLGLSENKIIQCKLLRLIKN